MQSALKRRESAAAPPKVAEVPEVLGVLHGSSRREAGFAQHWQADDCINNRIGCTKTDYARGWTRPPGRHGWRAITQPIVTWPLSKAT